MSIVIKAIADAMDGDREPYGWIIDENHVQTDPEDVGLMGPSDIAPEIVEQLKAGQGRRWRMYDADGELNYSGRILTPADPEGGGDIDFAPLNDYGKGGAGCTEISYYDAQKDRWETL